MLYGRDDFANVYRIQACKETGIERIYFARLASGESSFPIGEREGQRIPMIVIL